MTKEENYIIKDFLVNGENKSSELTAKILDAKLDKFILKDKSLSKKKHI